MFLFRVLTLFCFAKLASASCSMMSCDECLQSVGCVWCADESMPGRDRCRDRSLGVTKQWCEKEVIDPPDSAINRTSLDDSLGIIPQHLDIATRLRNPVAVTFQYRSSSARPKKIQHTLMDTKQNNLVSITYRNQKCEKLKTGSFICNTTALFHVDSCAMVGDQIVQGLLGPIDAEDEESLMEFRLTVPCSCSCSRPVEVDSPKCSGHGKLECGACVCREGWTGETCSEKKGCELRGDYDEIDCEASKINGMVCSGNGFCNCGTCVCNDDSKYYDSFCSDICMQTHDCLKCILRGDSQCLCNEATLLRNKEKNIDEIVGAIPLVDEFRIQIPCTVLLDDGCEVSYNASVSERRYIFEVDQSEECYVFGALVATVYVPAVIGVAAVLALASAGGFLAYKAFTKKPDVLSDLEYHNIDAEACKGENPLYKPPTSSFKNPMYKKT